MPTYNLFYFNGRGRAEICRILFAAAGVHYTDRRIKISEWNRFKNKMNFSILPVLQIDGETQIPQSMAIARYLAKEFGFHGKNNVDMARIESICDCLNDILDDYLQLYYEKNFSKKAALRDHYNDTCRRILPFLEKTLGQYDNGTKYFFGEQEELRRRYELMCDRILPYLEKTLTSNNSGNKWFVGDKILMCDLMCYSALENPLHDKSSLLKDYPKLQALRKRVAEHPKIDQYIKRREKTEF
ncbi:S-crystallin SL11-like [Octopus vulgaris]|uniref:S-crystallin SL11-like n=1 Tax=Octopus vulgaris TaxID=6645 RepID=A0AA36AUA3_OCTVU|nr:S-crystallin SL11-like [Octopus vulgaris]